MIANLFVLLLLNTLCDSAIFFIKENENDDEPFNLKLTNLLDIKINGKNKASKHDLSKILYSNIDDNDSDTNVIEKGTKQKPLITFDFAEGCKSLVGTSKIPICRFGENLDEKKIFPRSCREILERGNNKSGIFEIQPRLNIKPFAVLCDMETKGGGWTHIQKRFDGSQDFYLNWRDYKFGFGNLDAEFWIGLENIYHITGAYNYYDYHSPAFKYFAKCKLNFSTEIDFKSVGSFFLSRFELNELLIELTDREHKTAYAQYATFAIGPEKDGYPLSVLKGFTGDAGDSLTHHLGSKFTTIDVDQDENPSSNCAQQYVGAWWYKNCHASNLNGKYMNIVLAATYKFHGLNWSGFRGQDYNLAGSRMLVRPLGR